MTKRSMAGATYSARFRAKLWRYPGQGGWHFATVPAKYAPRATHGWGRTPVRAIVDGYEWSTSVWRGKEGRTLLAVPKAARGTKGDGDTVQVEIRFTAL
jgi:Domain of unknown function (DUF1905)